MNRLRRLALMCAMCAMGAAGPAVLAQAPPTERQASDPRELPPLPPLSTGEERVTPLDDGDRPCYGMRRSPGFRLGQDQVIRKNEVIDNFATVFGSVVVEGHVCGDLSVTLGDVRLASGASVEGTLVVVGGTATIEPGATVGGELVLVGGTLDAPADFRPGRDQVVVGIPLIGTRLREAVPYVTRGLLFGRVIVPDLGWVWAVVGVVFFVQLLLNLLFPQATGAATSVMADRPLSTFMAGMLVLVLSAPVAALLAVTVIGIAALPVLFGALLIAWVIGKIAVNRWIGTRLFEQDDPGSRAESTRSFLIGFVVITIAYMIPLLGLVVWGLTGVLGLGAAALAVVGGFRRENPTPPRPAPRDLPPMPPPMPPPLQASPLQSMAHGVAPGLAGAAVVADGGQEPELPREPPTLAPGVPPAPRAAAAMAADPRALLAFPRASFGVRTAAFALDVLLVAMLSGMLGADEPGDFFVPLLVSYHVAFWLWKATTLGGIICQLRVARVDGEPLRFVDALVRGLVGVFSIAAFGLGALWILRDPERQSWHDKVAGTAVVRVPRNYPLP